MTTTVFAEKTNAPRHRLERALRLLPKPAEIVMRAAAWLDSVDQFRADELDELEAEGKSNEKSGHRGALCGYIADGEALVCLVKRHGWLDSFKDFTLADVQATLESLHTTFRCRYGPRPHPARKAELAAFLDA